MTSVLVVGSEIDHYEYRMGHEPRPIKISVQKVESGVAYGQIPDGQWFACLDRGYSGQYMFCGDESAIFNISTEDMKSMLEHLKTIE